MFLTENILNEGKGNAINSEASRQSHSEWKNPKSLVRETKLTGYKSTKSQACVNSNWQKLRG
jgi:hypothetical protein